MLKCRIEGRGIVCQEQVTGLWRCGTGAGASAERCRQLLDSRSCRPSGLVWATARGNGGQKQLQTGLEGASMLALLVIEALSYPTRPPALQQPARVEVLSRPAATTAAALHVQPLSTRCVSMPTKRSSAALATRQRREHPNAQALSGVCSSISQLLSVNSVHWQTCRWFRHNVHI